MNNCTLEHLNLKIDILSPSLNMGKKIELEIETTF